jgi:inosose dehydratase
MQAIDRRLFLAGCAAAVVVPSRGRSAENEPASIGLGFSLYGMKSLPLAEAARACADIGYDCVELPVMEGWPADSAKFDAAQQNDFRRILEETGLRLSSLMENLPLGADDARHAANLERLRGAGKLARGVSPEGPRVVETVLGGRPEQWEAVKDRMAQRLREWAKVAEEEEFTLAIKAHVGGALHTPEDCVWLATQAESPCVKCVYDYSHFQLRGFDLAKSIQTLLPHTVFIHVKDAQGDPSRFQFLLPGDGDTDYRALLKLVAAIGYCGDVVVEVSGQLFGKPDYRPLDAARRCYENLAAAFETAGIRRR